MSEYGKEYPDNAELYALKSEGRRRRASLSFVEKLDAVDALKARIRPIVRAREARKQIAQTGSDCK